MDRRQDEKDLDLKFYERLTSEMRFTFTVNIKTPSVRNIFHEIDPNVLNAVDLERIKACQAKEGDREASSLLLDCLIVYKDWFPCLIKVLRHADVKLDHVADKFEGIYKKLHNDFFPKSSNSSSNKGFQRQQSNKKSKPDRDGKSSLEEPMNTFTLQERPEIERDSPMLSDEITAPSSALLKKQKPSDDEEEEPDGSKPKSGAHKKQSQKGHGPDYDFSYSETSTALKDLEGWHTETDERKIEEILRKLCNEDGHYILWFWERKQRPGVCVTSGKRIKTYIVHKRPGKKGEATKFYIDRNGKTSSSLQDLLSHHLKEGINDMSSSNKTINFVKPVNMKDSE